MDQRSPGHRKRCKRWDVPWDAHFLTFSCFHRQPLLSRDRSRRWMLQAIAAARKRAGFKLWGYVIMPEHVHVLLLPHEGTRIHRILTAIKQPVAQRAVHWVRRNAPRFLSAMADRRPGGKVAHRFWQRGGGYDRNLRSARDVHEKLTYLHENPLRRRLVETLEGWPWSSWHAWQTGWDEPIPIDREQFPVLETL